MSRKHRAKPNQRHMSPHVRFASLGRCNNRHEQYGSQRAAVFNLASLKRKLRQNPGYVHYPELHVFRCDICNAWHVGTPIGTRHE